MQLLLQLLLELLLLVHMTSAAAAPANFAAGSLLLLLLLEALLPQLGYAARSPAIATLPVQRNTTMTDTHYPRRAAEELQEMLQQR